MLYDGSMSIVLIPVTGTEKTINVTNSNFLQETLPWQHNLKFDFISDNCCVFYTINTNT